MTEPREPLWIDIKLSAPRCRPERKTPGSSGYDLVAFHGGLVKQVAIGSGDVRKVGTGVRLSMPLGVEAQVRPRSGLSVQGIIGILGTIDSDYRGEVCVLLHNTTADTFIVNAGERIGQLVFSRVLLPALMECEVLDGTSRGDGGFGSTGSS